MFWIICIIIGIFDFILIKLTIGKDYEDIFDEEDKFLPAIFIIGPLIPILNLVIFILLCFHFISEINWSKIFYKIYGKKRN